MYCGQRLSVLGQRLEDLARGGEVAAVIGLQRFRLLVGFVEPFHCLSRVFRHALTLGVHAADRILRTAVAAVGKRAEKFQRGGVVSFVGSRRRIIEGSGKSGSGIAHCMSDAVNNAANSFA